MSNLRISSTTLVAALAAGSLFLAGCGDEQARPASAAANAPSAATNEVPDWVNDPTMGGKFPLAAYGTAEKMLSGEDMQRKKAMQSARDEIAKVVSSKIQSVFKDWTREGGEITSQDNKQMAMTMSESVSRNLTNQVLQGTAQRARYIDKTGKMYLWVYVDAAAAEELQKQAAAQIRAEAEKRAHFASKIEADKAFADLDKLIDQQLDGGSAK